MYTASVSKVKRVWVNNNQVERFVIINSLELESLLSSGYTYGRIPSHRPPVKVKGCRRYREKKTYRYRTPNGTEFEIPEDIFHLKKEYYKAKGYKLCRKSPYSVSENDSDAVREWKENKREEYKASVSRRFRNTVWISSRKFSRRLDRFNAELVVETNPDFCLGRRYDAGKAKLPPWFAI